MDAERYHRAGLLLPALAGLVCGGLSFAGPSFADPLFDDDGATRAEVGGHVKGRVLAAGFPRDSLFRELVGSTAFDVEGDLRLNLELGRGGWALHADYQLFGARGDQVELRQALPGEGLFFPRVADDDRRLMDLTHTLYEDDRNLWLHRLDRLWLGYTGARTVVRIGRQSLSWGNGLFYAPMDLVNPFDPATIDTEYKFGDDMLYTQYLLRSGADLQGAAVVRRNPMTGEVESAQATTALKFHGFAGEWEFDLLLAEHYDDLVAGVGGVRALGGALWRGDLVVSDTASGTYVQVVTNLSHSWVWGDRNVTGAVEYFYNEFGFRDGPYDAQRLASNPELLRRLARGDLYTLGRSALGGNLLVEVTPLWTVSPTVLVNLGDGSALFQLITRVSLADEAVLLGSLNLPLGRRGTEYGGIETPVEDRTLSTDYGIFLQLARYF
ncbi:MAG: hypothetical protein V2I57_13185 [Xanthomonadales bacterium]|jgi:hypothetical protein|nr:hypothetical protein [Xanthomonadales bacterium]